MEIYKVSFEHGNYDDSFDYSIFFEAKPTKQDILDHLNNSEEYLEEFIKEIDVFDYDEFMDKHKELNEGVGWWATTSRMYVSVQKISVDNNCKDKECRQS